MSNKVKMTGALFIGVVLGALVMVAINLFWLQPPTSMQDQSMGGDEKKPEYWVAPMDANYKRNKPGKSPMGMDLIPVYEDGGGSDKSPGTVRISPDVVNNLGVRTTVVKRQALHAEIKTVGYVRYDENHLVDIHPRVKGWIEKLYVKTAGDPVEKGQPLYRVYSPELVNAQEELVLAVRRKNQRLVEASENRLRALHIPGGVINRLKKNQKVSQTVTFYAPQGGVVDNLNIREGFYVQPTTTLMSIGALNPIWVEAEIFERQASMVTKDLPVTMTMDYKPGKQWVGNVDYIYPTVDPKTRTIKVRLRFSNEKNDLKPNMFTQVVIHSQSAADTLLVPKESVIRTGKSDRVVLAIGEGQFKSVNVKVGRFDDQNTEILNGLSEGDKVVVSAQFLLDSESSKTSDFKRMNHEEIIDATRDITNNQDKAMSDSENSAEMGGAINTIMADHRMVNVTHESIPKWNMPAMSMDFYVSDQIDLSRLKKGMKIHLKFIVDRGRFLVTEISDPMGDRKHDQSDDQE